MVNFYCVRVNILAMSLLCGTACGLFADYVIESDIQEEPLYLNPSTEVGGELDLLDKIIHASEENVEKAKLLKNKLSTYLHTYSEYKKNVEDKRLCFLLVKSAFEALQLMKELDLTYCFDQQFLSELTFFSNIAEKPR